MPICNGRHDHQQILYDRNDHQQRAMHRLPNVSGPSCFPMSFQRAWKTPMGVLTSSCHGGSHGIERRQFCCRVHGSRSPRRLSPSEGFDFESIHSIHTLHPSASHSMCAAWTAVSTSGIELQPSRKTARDNGQQRFSPRKRAYSQR